MDACSIVTRGMVSFGGGGATAFEVREPPDVLSALELKPYIGETDPTENIPDLQEAETLRPQIVNSDSPDLVDPPDMADATDLRPKIIRVF